MDDNYNKNDKDIVLKKHKYKRLESTPQLKLHRNDIVGITFFQNAFYFQLMSKNINSNKQ